MRIYWIIERMKSRWFNTSYKEEMYVIRDFSSGSGV
jgi:hypothetical protein